MPLSSSLSSWLECPHPGRSRRRVAAIVAAAEEVLRVQLPYLQREFEPLSKGRDRAEAASSFERGKLRMLTFSNGDLDDRSLVMLLFVHWRDHMRLTCNVPASRAADAENLLCTLAAAAGAWWGITWTTGIGRFNDSLRPDPLAKNRRPRKGFPQLMHVGLADSPQRPLELGWLNYWSRDAARLVGDEGGEANLRDLDGGAKLLRLTQPVLDPKKKTHLSKLQAAYAQFPGVGRVPAVHQ